MEGLIVVGTLVAVVVAVILLWRGAAPATAGTAGDSEVDLTLEIGDVNPEDPAVLRLVHGAAARVFAEQPDTTEVRVRTRSGAVLTTVSRAAHASATSEMPYQLLEPHARHSRTPDPSAHLSEQSATEPAHFAPGTDAPHRGLLESFDVPESVRARVSDPSDAHDLVRAILEAAGRQTEVDGDVIRSGGDVVIVIRSALGTAVTANDLNQAFHSFQESKAPRGVVVSPGSMPTQDIRRREAQAPALRHAGPAGIQRMADAVAVGADPMGFVVGVPVRGR